MRISTGIILATAAGFALLLNHQRGESTPINVGEVYVFYLSKCATPGVADNCSRMGDQSEQSFSTMDDCWKYGGKRLNEIGDLTVMGSCQKMRES